MENLFNASQPQSISVFLIIVNLVLSFGLSFLIAVTYRNTHKGISYSQSFTFTLILIGVLISVILMIIGNSLAIAFGAFGAFSIIRFRTAIKDTKDVAFILIVVAIGLAVGTGNYNIAVLTTIFSMFIVYTLTKFNFGAIRRYDYILAFEANTENFSNEKMRELFKEYLKYDNLLNVASRDGGKLLDYSFNIKFKKSSDIEKFTKKLSNLEGASSVDIVSAKNDIEY